MLVLMRMESCVVNLFHRNIWNPHFLWTFDDVCGKMYGENLKNGALENDISTTALPLGLSDKVEWLQSSHFVYNVL